MKKIKTNIKGFDKLIEGGFPIGATVLLSGNPGTGKTIFSLEYLYRGASENKECGIYFTFEEKKEALLEQAKQFGFDYESLEKKGLLKIISIGSKDISTNTIKEILEIIKSTKAKKIVIDSLTTLSFIAPESIHTGELNQYSIRKFLYQFITELSSIKNLNSICISQRNETISNNISEFLCDGVIIINSQSLGSNYNRNIQVKKMRRVKNNDDVYPVEITLDGLIIHSENI